jgi:hypothetical protein
VPLVTKLLYFGKDSRASLAMNLRTRSLQPMRCNASQTIRRYNITKDVLQVYHHQHQTFDQRFTSTGWMTKAFSMSSSPKHPDQFIPDFISAVQNANVLAGDQDA